MDDSLLMRVLHPFTHPDEQLQTVADRQAFLVAVVGDRNTRHVFHDEIRLSVGGRGGVKHLGNRRMIHDRQRLPLHLKSLQHLVVVQAGFDKLQRDFPLYGGCLFRQPHLPHTTSPNFLHEPVGSENSVAL